MRSTSLPFGVSLLAAILLAFVSCSDPEPPSSPGTGGAPGTNTCDTNADCEDGLACIDGTCAHCVVNGDCGRTQFCDSVDFTCRFLPGWGDQCSLNDDCSLGSFCSQGLCKAAADVERCYRGTTCSEGQRCNHQTTVCEQDLGCFDDGDCETSERCNPGTGFCEPGCTDENVVDVCGPTEMCVDGRCVRCIDDGDCGEGLKCNVDAGRCVGESTCLSDRDCSAGLVCNRLTRTCTEQPPPCASNSACDFDERCDLRTGRCVLSACIPDRHHPNGTQEEAVTIGRGEENNLIVCQGEEKWYTFDLNEGDRVSIHIDADQLSAGGLDAQLRTEDGRVLVSNPFALDTTVSEGGPHFLRIRTRDDWIRYNLTFLVSPGTPCKDDRFVENRDPSSAGLISLGDHSSRRESNLTLCPGTVDWYMIESAPGNLSISLLQGPHGNLEATLYDRDAVNVLDSNDSLDAEKVLRGTTSDRVYLKVQASDRRTRNDYDLEISRD